jgi:hypothetical protein
VSEPLKWTDVRLAQAMMKLIGARSVSADYARAEGIAVPTVHYLINRAIKQGIVTRSGTKRVPQIDLTDYGRELVLGETDPEERRVALRVWNATKVPWAGVDASWMEERDDIACRRPGATVADDRAMLDDFFTSWLHARGSRQSDSDEIARARAICATCPAWVVCLEYAVAAGMVDGVWGGHTTPEREVYARDGVVARRFREARARQSTQRSA